MPHRRQKRGALVLALACAVLVVGGVLIGAGLSNQPRLDGKTVTIGIDPWDVAAVGGSGRRGQVAVLESGGVDLHDKPTTTGEITVVDARAGTTLHRIPVGKDPFEMEVDARTGHAFVLDQDALPAPAIAVHAVDTVGGRLLWTRPLLTLPGVGRGQRTTGTMLTVVASWSMLDGRGAMAIDDSAGRLFVVNRITSPRTRTTPTMYLLDTSKGTIVRTIRLPTPTFTVAVDPRVHHAFATSVSRNAVWMLDSRTGALLRMLRTASIPGAIAVDGVRDEVVVAGPAAIGSGGIAHVFSARTGRLLHTIPIRSYPFQITLDMRQDRAFVLDQAMGGDPRANGSVTMIDLKAGQVRQTTVVGSNPTALVVDEQAGRVFVVNQAHQLQNGTVMMLDASTGRLLKTITVGFRPTAITLDRQTGHVVVISQSASAPHQGIVADVVERFREFTGVSNERGIMTLLDERDLALRQPSFTLYPQSGAHAARAATPAADRQPVSVNDSLVVLDTRAKMGPGQAGAARLLTVQGGQVAHVLARKQAAPSSGGIAPSPRGLYIAYATNRSTSSALSPQTPGLRQVSSTGGAAHFIVPPPIST